MHTPHSSSAVRAMDETKKLFVINGYPGSGKTTFGQMVGDYLGLHHIHFLHTSSIDPIKYILMPRASWDPEIFPPQLWDTLESCKREITDQDWDGVTKDVYWRGVMSQLKARLLEATPTLVRDYIFGKIATLVAPCVVFVDIREPENIAALKAYANQVHPTIPVQAVFIDSDVVCDFDNPSDARVKEYAYDITIDNTRTEAGILHLRKQVQDFCKQHVLSPT